MARKSGVLKQKNRKKKETKQAPKDFVKVKRKVGKKEKAATNETRTEFRSKQVQLLHQSVLADKGKEVTHRKQSLQELLAHCHHHSPKVRRDAYTGLLEICTLHEAVLGDNLAKILENTTAAAVDLHASVRSAFRNFQAWMISKLPVTAITAFAPLLALHVRTALSHVSAEVREDGLLLLELYATKLGAAQVLTAAEVERMVETLCQVLTKSDVVLSCLCKLIQRGADEGDDAAADWKVAADWLRPAKRMRQDSPAKQKSVAMVLQEVVGRGGGQQSKEGAASSSTPDSPVWTRCLRAWLQASGFAVDKMTVPSSGKGTDSRTSSKSILLVRLRCAAVLEKSLEVGLQGSTASSSRLVPSAGQVSSFAATASRGEWPLPRIGRGPQIVLVDSTNLRMARVAACLLARGAKQDHPREGKKGASSGSANSMAHLAQAAMLALEGASAADWEAPQDGSKAASEGHKEAGIDEVLGGRAAVKHALGTLDILWSYVVMKQEASGGNRVEPQDSGATVGAIDLPRLVSLTARFSASPGTDPSNEQSGEHNMRHLFATPNLPAISERLLMGTNLQ